MICESPTPSSVLWRLEINLRDDFDEICYHALRRAGYKDASREKAVYQYYNLCKRSVDMRPRKVVYSREFECPESYRLALEEFEERVRKGRSLKPFMSDKHRELNYDDLLLNDWNVYHFHLSRQYKADGSVKRSDYEIFAYITDEVMYMIQIYHHRTKDLYSRQEIMRILHDNWPELLEPFRFQDAIELKETYSDHQLGQIRQSHAMTLLQIRKGQIYGMIGGGYASNGYSGEALRKVDFWHRCCDAFQQAFIENADKIGKMIFHDKEIADMRIGLLGITNADNVTVIEMNSSYIIKLNIKDGNGRVYSQQAYFEEITQKGHNNNLVMELAGKSRK